MSIQATNWIWHNSSHKGGPLLVLLAIADHAHDDGGGAYPSIDTLAFKSRLSTRQVKRVLHELVESGELVIEPNAGPRGANLYTVTFERGKDEMSPLTGPDSDDEEGGDILSPPAEPAGEDEGGGDILSPPGEPAGEDEGGGDILSPPGEPAGEDEGGGDILSPPGEPAGEDEGGGDILGKVGPDFIPGNANVQSCVSDFPTALKPSGPASLGAVEYGAGGDILGQTGKECHGDISDNSWGHLGPEGVTFPTVLGDIAMSPEPLEPSIKPSTEPLINCQGAREKIPEKTDPVPSTAVEAVKAPGGPDIPPPRRRRPAEPRTSPTVTEEFRARMRQKHLGEGFDVDTEIDRALNHEAVLKAIKVELYVQNWLRRQAQWESERPRANARTPARRAEINADPDTYAFFGE